MLQTEVARAILSVECISAVEIFQVIMKEKQKYVAHHVRLSVSLTLQAASTSPVDRGYFIKIGQKHFAPNAIFRVGSCSYILYDLTCSFSGKNPPTA